jgi:hypothetical protein
LVTTVIDTTSVKDEISGASWNNALEDVYAENGVLVFPEDSTEDTKLITKGMAKPAEGVKNLLTVDARLQFVKLPEGKKFILACGLGAIESSTGEKGNLEIVFENKGGLKISVVAYTAEGEGTHLVKEKRVGSLKDTAVKAVVTTEQELVLKIGGKEIFHGKIPVSGEGRIGFIQTGSCAVKVKDININTFKYNRPENCDINESFDNGEFNANLLTSKLVSSRKDAVKPAMLGVEDIDGNNAFRFYKVSTGYLSTVYDYSNFEMSFDVPFLRRNAELDEEGKLIETRSNDIIVAFGLQGNSFTNDAWTGAHEYLLFTPTNRIKSKSTTTVPVGDLYSFFDGADNKGFSVKIAVIDGTVSVSLKWIEETKWTEVMKYALDTPTGTISIWTASGDYAIDNLKIYNKDNNPKLVSTEYKSSIIEAAKDWEYVPSEKVYVDNRVMEDNSQTSWYGVIPVVGGFCLLGLLTALFIRVIKNRKRTEGEKVEN